MTSPATPTATCPSCGHAASGKFCAECGASLVGTTCASCSTALSPGARFCHRCGTPAGTAATPVPYLRDGSGALPWALAAIALVALIALVAGQRFRSSATPAGPEAAAGAPAMPNGVAGQRAPDISQLTPEQRAERLYDRMMSMAERGQKDSVQFFSPMAMQAYQMLDSLNLDQRYDLGRLGEISGNAALAKAEADTILARDPNHLLGHLLAANAAAMTGDARGRATHLTRLAALEPTERARALPEYLLHQSDIKSALAQASALKP